MPSYNTGPILAEAVRDACAAWGTVWIVVDGSTDGSDRLLDDLPPQRVLQLPRNRGKGAAVLHGARAALSAGFTHALVMDADGQHAAADIGRFMAASRTTPDALILGQPLFGPDAPLPRLVGRRVSNLLTRLEAAPCRPGDGLFGFRVYPIAPLLAVMGDTRFMRGFDFDPEAVVRLAWRGHPAIRIPTRVRYPPAAKGGISQFRYLRDNLLLSLMHARLLAGAAGRQIRPG